MLYRQWFPPESLHELDATQFASNLIPNYMHGGLIMHIDSVPNYEYAFVLKTMSKHCLLSTIAASTQNNTCFELFWSDSSSQYPVFCCRNGWPVETMDFTFWCRPRSPTKGIWPLYFIPAAVNIHAYNFTQMTENYNLICSTADLRFPSLRHRDRNIFSIACY